MLVTIITYDASIMCQVLFHMLYIYSLNTDTPRKYILKTTQFIDENTETHRITCQSFTKLVGKEDTNSNSESLLRTFAFKP